MLIVKTGGARRLRGLGDGASTTSTTTTSTSSFMDTLKETTWFPSAGIPNWGILLGGVVLASSLGLFGSGARR